MSSRSLHSGIVTSVTRVGITVIHSQFTELIFAAKPLVVILKGFLLLKTTTEEIFVEKKFTQKESVNSLQHHIRHRSNSGSFKRG